MESGAKKTQKKIIAEFIDWLYLRQSEKYGGDTTLNELRVAARCYRAYSSNETMSISHLTQSLQIPSSTVHRSVTNLINKGWLKDTPDPDDGRRRRIELSEKGVAGGLWQEALDKLATLP